MNIRKIGPTVAESVGARVKPEDKRKLVEYCEQERITVSALISKLIVDFLKRVDKVNSAQVFPPNTDK